jgi:hypothetical protein
MKSVISHTAAELGTDAFLPHLSVLAGMTDRSEQWLFDKMVRIDGKVKRPTKGNDCDATR